MAESGSVDRFELPAHPSRTAPTGRPPSDAVPLVCTVGTSAPVEGVSSREYRQHAAHQPRGFPRPPTLILLRRTPTSGNCLEICPTLFQFRSGAWTNAATLDSLLLAQPNCPRSDTEWPHPRPPILFESGRKPDGGPVEAHSHSHSRSRSRSSSRPLSPSHTQLQLDPLGPIWQLPIRSASTPLSQTAIPAQAFSLPLLSLHSSPSYVRIDASFSHSSSSAYPQRCRQPREWSHHGDHSVLIPRRLS